MTIEVEEEELGGSNSGNGGSPFVFAELKEMENEESTEEN